MCFDAFGNLYATNFDANNMTKFDDAGNVLIHPFGTGFNGAPESCVRNGERKHLRRPGREQPDILKFSSPGAPQGPSMRPPGQGDGLDRPRRR